MRQAARELMRSAGRNRSPGIRGMHRMFPIHDDQPKYSPSIITTLLIVVNALVFLFEISLDEYSRNLLIMRYGLVPAHFHPSALVTSMFLHGGWAHIIGNMLFLWAFGRSLEDCHGAWQVPALLSAVRHGGGHLPGFFQCWVRTLPSIGASGAIAGVMGAYLVKFPRARIQHHHLLFLHS